MEKSWSKIKPIVRNFHVFGSEALAHIPDKKQKALQPKSEKCIFVRYFEDVKGYRLLQPHSNDIIIRRDVQLYENISCYNPNSTSMPFVSYDPSSVLVPVSTPNFHLIMFQIRLLVLMTIVMMKFHLFLLIFLQLHQHNCFLDGSAQHEKKLVIFLVIQKINT